MDRHQGRRHEFLRDGRFRVYTTKDALADNAVYAIEEDANGGRWVGSRAGLSRNGRGRVADLYQERWSAKRQRAVSAPGSWGKSVDRYEWGGLSRFRDGRFTVFTPKEGLASDAITSLVEDSSSHYCQQQRPSARIE
jgi:ligand-binding sensor domain-containing protein